LDYAPFHLSLEEVTEHAGREVLGELDNTSALIVGNPCGILGQQLKTRAIYLLNIIIK
jgi:hypothetical protein